MTKSRKMLRKWRKFLPLVALLLVLLSGLARPVTASAHPLGNFTVNRYSRLELGASGLKIYYVIDMAEIPTFQEKDIIDADHDGNITDAEKQAYLSKKVVELKSNLTLLINKAPVALTVGDDSLAFLPGQGGLETMRITATYQSAALAYNATSLNFSDSNYNDRIGWKEIVVRNGDGVAISNSSASSKDVSNELRTYPQDMLQSPLDVRSATVSFKLDPNAKANTENNNVQAATTPNTVMNRAQDPFADLLKTNQLTLGFVLFALLASFVLGGFHALSPGHGKTVVAAYLVGSRGTARHAAFLGLSVTVTHTLGVFALGIITLFASHFIVPDKLYPILSFTSGLILVVMGLYMVRSRWRSFKFKHSPDRDHDHEHSHTHYEHSHEHIEVSSPVLAMAADGGSIAASPSTMNFVSVRTNTHKHADGQTHSYEAEHHHDHDDHSHDGQEHTHSDNQEVEHYHDNEHSHANGSLVHSHGGITHSHLPPGTDNQALTWKSLLLFGISAGILPCPSALVVMLSAIALGQIAFGLILIIFFSMGLATTLIAMGLILVYARHLFDRVKVKNSDKILKLLPIGSAAFVAILGIIICVLAVVQGEVIG